MYMYIYCYCNIVNIYYFKICINIWFKLTLVISQIYLNFKCILK